MTTAVPADVRRTYCRCAMCTRVRLHVERDFGDGETDRTCLRCGQRADGLGAVPMTAAERLVASAVARRTLDRVQAAEAVKRRIWASGRA